MCTPTGLATDPPDAPRPNPGGVDGPVVGQEPLDVGASVEEAALGGTLQLVDECLVATSPDGPTIQRTLITWEFGMTWDQATTSVIQQGGERIAIGEELDLGGGFHPTRQHESLHRRLGRPSPHPHLCPGAWHN